MRPILTPVIGLFTLAGSASAACDTTFWYPGGTLTYQMVAGGKTTQMTSQAKPTATGVTVKSTVDGKTTSTTFKCVGNNLQAQVEGTQMGFSNLPDGKLWKPGYKWTSKMNITGAGGMPGMTSTTTYKVARMENVTTPAGTFNAYRVESDTVMKLPETLKLPAGVKIPGMGAPVHSTAWYAKGVGMVKMVQPENGVSMTLVKVKK